MKRWAAAFAEDIRRRRAAGISAAGERPDSFLFAIDMRGPEQFRILADKLAARGHSQRRIEKILGLNFLDYSRRIWSASSDFEPDGIIWQSEARRVGKECVSTCRFRGSPDH